MSGALAAYGSLISDDYPTRIYGVNCTGNEENILNCPIHFTSKGVEYTECATGDAGVFCQGMNTLTEIFYKSTLTEIFYKS